VPKDSAVTAMINTAKFMESEHLVMATKSEYRTVPVVLPPKLPNY
jgi:hypothetical protein